MGWNIASSSKGYALVCDKCKLYEVEFHPVGQGLFSSGKIFAEDGVFQFVYDCGSSSKAIFLKSEIEERFAKNESIDMVVLSHFDKDHVNGLIQLIERCKIKSLFVPALRPKLTLELAFKYPQITRDELSFYVDPVFFLEQRGRTKLVEVEPSDVSRKPKETTEYADGLSLLIEGDNPIYTDGTPVIIEQGHIRLPSGSRIFPSSKPTMEITPYYDEEVKEQLGRDSVFVDEIHVAAQDLIRKEISKQDFDREFRRLRNKLHDKLEKTPEKRNLISMFLYMKPTTQKECFFAPPLFDNAQANSNYNKSAILFSGDGYLNTPERVDNLINYLRDERLKYLGCFQLMHHGSKTNWMPGLAQHIAPIYSISTSSPSWYRHPHPEVIDDFKKSQCRNVCENKECRFKFTVYGNGQVLSDYFDIVEKTTKLEKEMFYIDFGVEWSEMAKDLFDEVNN